MASPTFIFSLVLIYLLTGVVYYLPKSSHHRDDENGYTINRNCQPPEQIHLSVTGKPSERVITFIVQTSTCPERSAIKYGVSPNHLSHSAQVTCKEYDAGRGRMLSILHSKIMDLHINKTYYYQISANGCSSFVHNFTTQQKLQRYGVYGDFGLQNDVSFNQLIAELEAKQFDMFLHVGDIAYNLYEESGKRGDKFLRMIQPLTVSTPYMVLPGNHEHHDNFTQYIHRYAGLVTGVGANSGSNTNLWYSFDQNNIHFIAIDTEVYAYFTDQGQIDRQVQWLANDLKKANANRHKTPWIIMLAHKAWWMDKTDFSKFSPLLHHYGVDLFICGHQHNYQRLYPTYMGEVDHQSDKNRFVNPKYATVLVVGSPGNRERISHGSAPGKAIAFSDQAYGYGHMIVHNNTHLYWKWELTGTESLTNGVKVLDEMWLIQEHHGMRN